MGFHESSGAEDLASSLLLVESKFTLKKLRQGAASKENIMEPSDGVTQLLVKWSNGDREALDKLMPLVYSELRRLAGNYLRRERQNHTLQPTALVNEAYLKLIDQKNAHWQNRAQFYGVAAQLMRRILVDHSRTHKAAN